MDAPSLHALLALTVTAFAPRRIRLWTLDLGLWTVASGLFELRPPFLNPLLNAFFRPLLSRFVITPLASQVILRNKVPFVIVGVFVTLPMAQPFRGRIMSIAQVFRDCQGPARFNILHR